MYQVLIVPAGQIKLIFHQISDDTCSISKFSENSRQLKKVKGTKSFDCCNEVFWDLSEANYDSAPEPISGWVLCCCFGEFRIEFCLLDVDHDLKNEDGNNEENGD